MNACNSNNSCGDTTNECTATKFTPKSKEAFLKISSIYLQEYYFATEGQFTFARRGWFTTRVIINAVPVQEAVFSVTVSKHEYSIASVSNKKNR